MSNCVGAAVRAARSPRGLCHDGVGRCGAHGRPVGLCGRGALMSAPTGHSRSPVVVAGAVALAGLVFSSVSMPRRILLALAVFLFVWLVLQAIFDNLPPAVAAEAVRRRAAAAGGGDARWQSGSAERGNERAIGHQLGRRAVVHRATVDEPHPVGVGQGEREVVRGDDDREPCRRQRRCRCRCR